MGGAQRKWQRTPVFLPRESRGQRSLVGYRPWGRRESEQLSNNSSKCPCSVKRPSNLRSHHPTPNSPAASLPGLSVQGGRKGGSQRAPGAALKGSRGHRPATPSSGHIRVEATSRSPNDSVAQDRRALACFHIKATGQVMPVSESSKGSNYFLGSETSQKHGDLEARGVPSLLVSCCQ